jgi:DNA-binding Lrp family transcriptional regulator
MAKLPSTPSKNNAKVGELRAALMAIEAAVGKSVKDIAAKYQVSTLTVRRDLSLAAESGFIDHYKALAHEGLVPTSLAVYEAHLQMGNLDAARDILYGLGVLQKAPADASKFKSAAIDSLDAYRAARRERKLPAPVQEEDHASIQ